jgi:hypothetical protein
MSADSAYKIPALSGDVDDRLKNLLLVGIASYKGSLRKKVGIPTDQEMNTVDFIQANERYAANFEKPDRSGFKNVIVGKCHRAQL